MTVEKDLKDILKRLDKIEEFLKPAPPQNPWSPMLPPAPYPYDPLPIAEPTCNTCGIKYSNMGMYVCPRTDCPSGIRYTSTTAESETETFNEWMKKIEET
jgi:hypothetical protein